MSTTDVQALPAGAWQVDEIHSNIAFAVDYMAGTFHGTFSDFDAQVHPELTFTSNAIKRDEDRVTIDGEITIKGHTEAAEITGEISDPIADPHGGERFGLKLQAVVDRDRFGVSWNNPLPSGEPALSNEVTIIAELQLAKQG